MNSIVFLDDSIYEIEMVNAFLPEVLAVQYEENSILFSRLRTIFSHALESLPLTPNRSLMYKQDVIREREKAQYKTVEAYLESLEMFFKFSKASKIEEVHRISELSQRTHRCNLSNTHYDVEELLALVATGTNDLFIGNLKDRFGDLGIICAAVVEYTETEAIIQSFYFSCRAFGRNLEYQFLNAVKKECAKKKLESIKGVYRPTEQNSDYVDFYKMNGVEYYYA